MVTGMDWQALMEAYPSDREGIQKAKALRERIDHALAEMEIPALDPSWQEEGALVSILPDLGDRCERVWRETFNTTPAFDMQKALAVSIGEGQTPDLPGIDNETLEIIINHAFAQLLRLLRERNAALIPEAWQKGVCPFCGTHPRVAFDAESERTVGCPLCGYVWRFPRLRCPVCNNTDHTTLGYFDAEGIEGVRVSFCRECTHYLKVVDTRVRPVHDHETEDALTLELDELARREGFKPAP